MSKVSQIKQGFSIAQLSIALITSLFIISALTYGATNGNYGSVTIVIWGFLIVITIMFVFTIVFLGNKKLEKIQNERSDQLPVDFKRVETASTGFYLSTLIKREGFVVKGSYVNNYKKFENGDEFGDFIAPIYKIGSDHDSLLHYDLYTIYCIKLKGIAPHVFFDSKLAKGKQATLYFAENQEYKFEGLDEDLMTAYMPPNQGIDVLSDITPDVLKSIIDAAECDVELTGNRLQLYAPLWPNAKSQLDYMKEHAEKIALELNQNIIKFRRQQLSSEAELRTVNRIVKKIRLWPWVIATIGSWFYLLIILLSLLPSSNNSETRNTSNFQEETPVAKFMIVIITFLFVIGITTFTIKKSRSHKKLLK